MENRIETLADFKNQHLTYMLRIPGGPEISNRIE